MDDIGRTGGGPACGGGPRAPGYPLPIVDHAEERAEALRRYRRLD